MQFKMTSPGIRLSLSLLILALINDVRGYNKYPSGTSMLLQTPNELLSEQNAESGESYTNSALLTVESICNTALEIYFDFGNDTIQPFDSCNYTYGLLGISSSEFTDGVPYCLSDVVDIFCTFDLVPDDTVLSTDLFDFIISSIKYCVEGIDYPEFHVSCPGLDTNTQVVTDIDSFCSGLWKMTDVANGDDYTLVSLTVASEDDLRTVYKYVSEAELAECKQITESYNYCLYVEQILGADVVTNCYDKTFEMYNSLHVKLYNNNIKEVCGNIVVPTLIYYSALEDLTLGSNIYGFCQDLPDLNSNTIEERITNVTAIKDQNAKNISNLRASISSLNNFSNFLNNSLTYISEVEAEFLEFYELMLAKYSDQIVVSEIVKANIIFLNDTMVQTVAYAEIYKENVTDIEQGDIVSELDLATADTNQMLNLLNVTYELLIFINTAVNSSTNSNITSTLNAEGSESSNNTTDTTTISEDFVIQLYDIINEFSETTAGAITNLNVFTKAEIATLTAEVAALNAENQILIDYIGNLISQRGTNVDLASNLIS